MSTSNGRRSFINTDSPRFHLQFAILSHHVVLLRGLYVRHSLFQRRLRLCGVARLSRTPRLAAAPTVWKDLTIRPAAVFAVSRDDLSGWPLFMGLWLDQTRPSVGAHVCGKSINAVTLWSKWPTCLKIQCCTSPTDAGSAG